MKSRLQREPVRLTESPQTDAELAAAIRAVRASVASPEQVARLSEGMRARQLKPEHAPGRALAQLRHPRLWVVTLATLTLTGSGSLWAASKRVRKAPAPPTAVVAPPIAALSVSAEAAPSVSETHESAAPPQAAPAHPRVRIEPKSRTPRAAKARPHVAVAPQPGELELLESSQAALERDPRRALDLTEQHARAYPAGIFAQEREMLAIEALQKLRRRSEALTRARRFADAYPDSAHTRRLAPLLSATVLPRE